MDFGVLIAASRPPGGPRQPSLSDLDHIADPHRRNNANDISQTQQGYSQSPRLLELARPRNESKMSLSNNPTTTHH